MVGSLAAAVAKHAASAALRARAIFPAQLRPEPEALAEVQLADAALRPVA
jgi:hypothetical protein